MIGTGKRDLGWRAMALTVLLGLAGALAGCGGGGDTLAAQADPVAKATPKAPAPLARVQLPVNEWTGEHGQHVVRNVSEWDTVWAANSAVWPPLPAPALNQIDFKQHMLVGVVSSYGGCSGHIAILSAELEATPAGEAWVVRFQADERDLTPGLLCADDIKPMGDFIVLPQNALPVRFVELPRPE